MPACRQEPRPSGLRIVRALPKTLSGLLLCVALGTTGCLEINQQTVGGGSDPCKPNPCQTKGVCTAWTGTCTVKSGAAVCAWKYTKGTAPKVGGKTLTAPEFYQPTEAACDGKDNDCDGQTDESTVATAADLAKDCSESTQGVCKGSTPLAVCAAGKWSCAFKGVADYQPVEASCDGKDNDCNGVTDENLVASTKDCKGLGVGVCAQTTLAPPACTSGAWDCAAFYGAIQEYEAAETLCDGLDNDCDGIVDANLAPSTEGLEACLNQGQCASNVTRVCKGGIATCDYSAVEHFEATELTCDGWDNDCDGNVDNFAGGTAPLSGAPTGCETLKGVCGAGTAQKICKDKKMQCSYAGVPGYEASEISCDGKDNDCDGTVDNLAAGTKPAKSPCGTGVCVAGKAKCESGLWTCDYSSVAEHEIFEQTCDGKDNDCNGKTDESAPTAANCGPMAKLGVCAFGGQVSCDGGKATCNFSFVAGYEKDTEKSCDGLDNDCDGNTDEKDGLDDSKSGCKLGICDASGLATCSTGKWVCDESKVVGYQGNGEISCDGKDNDCDGLTDENLSDPGPAGANCKKAGVCATSVTANCAAGSWLCNYGAIATYENKELSCDGLDNDCDGVTDVGAGGGGVCAGGAACAANGQCASGTCVQVTGGAKVCAPKTGQCGILAGGITTWTDDGGTICNSTTATQKCVAGAWAAASFCASSAPQCIEGACVLCAPNSAVCDPADKSKVGQCSADGKSLLPASSCAAGTHCAGAGACISDTAFAATDGGSASVPVGVALKDGSFALAWLSEENGGTEVRLRVAAADGTWKGPSSLVAGSKPALTATCNATACPSRIAIAPLGTGFALAWVTGPANASQIALRLFDGSGAPKAATSIASASAALQTEPALASNGTTLLLAWTDSTLDGDGTGIAFQLFDSTGKSLGSAAAANSQPGSSLSPTTGDQGQPAAAMKATGEFVVAWTTLAAGTAKANVRGRAFGADGTPAADVKPISSAAGVHNVHPSITFSQSTAVAAWASFNIDGSGYGIAMRRFDSNLVQLAPAAPANSFTSGDQDMPVIAALSDGTSALAWQSVNAQGAANGLEVAARDVPQAGGFNPAIPEVDLSKPSPEGDQDMAGVVAFGDGRVLYLWRSRPTAGAAGEIWALFR